MVDADKGLLITKKVSNDFYLPNVKTEKKTRTVILWVESLKAFYFPVRGHADLLWKVKKKI